jgi:hypothetical protein
MLTWTFGREDIASWLYLTPGPDGSSVVDINRYAIQNTLVAQATEMGDGRGSGSMRPRSKSWTFSMQAAGMFNFT